MLDLNSSSKYNFLWGFNHHCRYGMSCPDIRNQNLEAERIARYIQPALINLTQSTSKEDEMLYKNILNLTRGYFPAIYHTLEIIRSEAKSNKKEV